MELEAEVEYWREKTTGLEAEVKGLSLERDWYKNEAADVDNLRMEVNRLTAQLNESESRLAVTRQERDFLQKEFDIQKVQLEQQSERLARAELQIPTPSTDRKHDAQKQVEAQASAIEKLLVKIKKLKQEKINDHFGIFNMANEDEPNSNTGTVVNTAFGVGAKAYREMIAELHGLMLK